MSILIGWLSTFFLRHHSPYINLLSTVSWTVSSECGKSRRSAFRILFGTPSVGGFILRSDRADAEAHPGLVALGEAWGKHGFSHQARDLPRKVHDLFIRGSLLVGHGKFCLFQRECKDFPPFSHRSVMVPSQDLRLSCQHPTILASAAT